MSLARCQEETPVKDYRTWMVWLSEFERRPVRSDFYLMQIARELRRIATQGKEYPPLSDLIIDFDEPADAMTPEEKKEANYQKAMAMKHARLDRLKVS